MISVLIQSLKSNVSEIFGRIFVSFLLQSFLLNRDSVYALVLILLKPFGNIYIYGIELNIFKNCL